MRYIFRCRQDGEFEITSPMREGPPKYVECPECQDEAARVYQSLTDIWHCQGAHKTDYDRYGDRKEALNKKWEAMTGEKAPEPAKDVPRNSSEKY